MRPGSFCSITARPRASGGARASVVTSPEPMSSSSARSIRSRMRWLGRAVACRRPPQQLCPDEAVEVAVENTLGVAHLVVRAVVLDHRVGVQYVGADLRAPAHVLGLALLTGQLLAARLLLELEELRAQHRHRGRLVRGLRALV